MTDEEMVLQLSEKSIKLLKAITEIANSIATDMAFRKSNRQIAKSLMMITENGKTPPYLQPFGKEYSKLAELLVEDIKKYNLNKPLKEQIHYFVSRTGDGKQVIWADKNSMDKIVELRNMLALNRGNYYTEVTPEELKKGYEGKEIYTFKGLTKDELNILRSKPFPSGNDYSFAATPNKDGTFDVSIRTPNLFTKELDKEDFLLNMIRTKAVLNSPVGYQIKDELAYDRGLKESLAHYKSEEPMYITSATDGGKYLRVTEKGFSLYEVGTNINDIRQHVLISMTKEGMDEKEYNKQLFKALNTMNRPVAINKEIYEKNEKKLLKVLGNDAKKVSVDARICGMLATEYNKVKLNLKEPEGYNLSAVGKQLAAESTRSSIAMIAAKATLELDKNGTKMSREEVENVLESKKMNKEIEASFYKEQLYHINPKLGQNFIDEVRETPLYQELQKSMISPETKDEIQDIIDSSYSDFIKEISPDLRNKIEEECQKYKDTVKENVQICIENKYSPRLQRNMDIIKDTNKDKALEVILANCVTGRVIEGVRPIQTSISELKAAEAYDNLAKGFANEIRTSIAYKIEKEGLVPDAEYFKSDAYKDLVDKTAKWLQKKYDNNELGEKNEEWHAIVLKCDEEGILQEKGFEALAEDAKLIAKYDIETVVVQQPELEKQTEIINEEQQEYWEMLEYDHDEEYLNNLLKEDIETEIQDVDLYGQTKETEKEEKDKEEKDEDKEEEEEKLL